MEDDWKPFCDKVKRIRMEYCDEDIIIDEKTNRLVISLGSDSDALGCKPETDMSGIKMLPD